MILIDVALFAEQVKYLTSSLIILTPWALYKT